MSRFKRKKVTITNCDIPTTIEAFHQGLIRESPFHAEPTKYPCKNKDDLQAKAMARVRLEEDRIQE